VLRIARLMKLPTQAVAENEPAQSRFRKLIIAKSTVVRLRQDKAFLGV
jgi:hypothetical protein